MAAWPVVSVYDTNLAETIVSRQEISGGEVVIEGVPDAGWTLMGDMPPVYSDGSTYSPRDTAFGFGTYYDEAGDSILVDFSTVPRADLSSASVRDMVDEGISLYEFFLDNASEDDAAALPWFAESMRRSSIRLEAFSELEDAIASGEADSFEGALAVFRRFCYLNNAQVADDLAALAAEPWR